MVLIGSLLRAEGVLLLSLPPNQTQGALSWVSWDALSPPNPSRGHKRQNRADQPESALCCCGSRCGQSSPPPNSGLPAQVDVSLAFQAVRTGRLGLELLQTSPSSGPPAQLPVRPSVCPPHLLPVASSPTVVYGRC